MNKIIYTITDEAPALATGSFFTNGREDDKGSRYIC